MSFNQLNKYLQNANQELITYDLLGLMFDEDARLQTLITNISPNGIEIGKKTDNKKLANNPASV